MSNENNSQLEEQNLALTKEVFTRISQLDPDGIMELVDDNGTIEFYGPGEIAYAGKYEGKNCRDFFTNIFASVDIEAFEPEEFICKGDKVVVVGQLHLIVKANRQNINTTFVHVITCKDGKWLVFQDFMNTHVAYNAFTNKSA